MKRTQLLSLITLAIVTTAITSCGSGREYYSQPYRSSARFSLIISPTPGFAMHRYSDGRYYYRSPEGYMYWRGYDNRFYLDRSYLNRGRYDQREYNEWKRYRNYRHRH